MGEYSLDRLGRADRWRALNTSKTGEERNGGDNACWLRFRVWWSNPWRIESIAGRKNKGTTRILCHCCCCFLWLGRLTGWVTQTMVFCAAAQQIATVMWLTKLIWRKLFCHTGSNCRLEWGVSKKCCRGQNGLIIEIEGGCRHCKIRVSWGVMWSGSCSGLEVNGNRATKRDMGWLTCGVELLPA